MHIKNVFIGVLLLGVITMSCNKTTSNTYIPTIDFESNKKAGQLISADNDFALSLFEKVNHLEEAENYMISPLSVSIALGMTYNGADGETKTAFEETLGFSGMDRHEINFIHGALITHLLNVDPKITLELANSIWVNDSYTLRQEFADTNRYYYDAEINTLNFGSPDAKEVINGWIADKTHDKIRDVLDEIPPATVMYLINAIYFYGSWKYEFKEEDTRPIPFYREDGTQTETEAMYLEGDLAYYGNEDFRMLELPYGNDKYAMVVVLPNAERNTESLLEEFTIENWEEWSMNLRETGINLTLPKFKFGYKTLLNQVLADLGLSRAFGGGAEFPLLVNESIDLYISRVIHESFIDVNEKGTEAAAVTVVEIRETSAMPGSGMDFTVDRPFLFLIREKTSNAIVFAGKVGNPEYVEE